MTLYICVLYKISYSRSTSNMRPPDPVIEGIFVLIIEIDIQTAIKTTGFVYEKEREREGDQPTYSQRRRMLWIKLNIPFLQK